MTRDTPTLYFVPAISLPHSEGLPCVLLLLHLRVVSGELSSDGLIQQLLQSSRRSSSQGEEREGETPKASLTQKSVSPNAPEPVRALVFNESCHYSQYLVRQNLHSE